MQTEAPASMSPLARFERHRVLLLVLLAHALLWLGLQALWRTPRSEASPHAPLRWRVLAPDVDAPTRETPQTPASPRQAGSKPPRSFVAPSPTPPIEAAPASPPTAGIAPEPAAEPSLLDAEATRRAVRATARSAGPLAQQAAEAGAELRASSAAQRLSSDMQQAGRGDCAKGEYAGGGMGLLSLPFLAAAAIKGECAK